MAGTLISYRGGDAPGHAGRLFDRLRARLPKHPLQKDVGQVSPGADFVQAIENAVANCDTALVVIGREWMSSTSVAGRRLDDPNDPVRLEIGAALRLKRRVIPVLVGGASMPREQELPGDIHGLARRQAVELRDASWDQDVEALIGAIGTRKATAGSDPIRRSLRRRAVILGGTLGIGLPLLLAWLCLGSNSSAPVLPHAVARVHPDLTLVGHNDIGDIAALPGQRIASLKAGEVTLWSLATGESQSLYKEYGIASIAAIPGGRLALGFWGNVKVLNPDRGKVEENINLHDPYPDGTDTSIDRLVLLQDGTLLSFSGVSLGFCDLKAQRGHVIPINSFNRFAVLSGGRVALLQPGGGIGVWNYKDQKPETLLADQPDVGPERDLAALPDGRIVTTSERAVLAVWSLDTGKVKILRAANSDRGMLAERLFALPDGRVASIGSESIEVWNVARDRPDINEKITGRRGGSLADPLLLADGRLILATNDGGMTLWSVQRSRPEAILEGHTKSVTQLLVLDDGRLASTAEDKTIRIWKLPPGGSPIDASERGQ